MDSGDEGDEDDEVDLSGGSGHGGRGNPAVIGEARLEKGLSSPIIAEGMGVVVGRRDLGPIVYRANKAGEGPSRPVDERGRVNGQPQLAFSLHFTVAITTFCLRVRLVRITRVPLSLV